jgi:hypothetical protein
MKQHTNVDFDIDAVIAWVDGNDEAHINKMTKYVVDKSKLGNQQFRTRFDQVNEIEFSVKSILKYAPFVRNIFIITDGQTPLFLKNHSEEYPKVKIVDHKEIFKGFESYAPTFNSISIETLVYQIPDLAEHFIYFNDDFFLIKETKQSDFFNKEYPIIRGKWTKYDKDRLYKSVHQKIVRLLGKKTKDKNFGFKRAQQNIALNLGFQKYLRLDHTPAAIRKSTINNYFEEHPEMIIHNIKHRFREPSQYMIQSLANHLEIQNKTCVIKNDYQLGYLQSYKKPLLWYKLKLKYFEKDTNTLFLCLQSLDQCPKHKLNYILNWLKKFN